MCSRTRFDGVEELVEMGDRVVRPRGGLGMILNPKNRKRPMPEPFDRPVVQVHVSYRQIRGITDPGFVAFDGKSMILRRYENAPGRKLLYGVIASTVSKRKLRRRSAEREAE